MTEARRIEVQITADMRRFERSELIFERTWWRRLWLRFLLWRIEHSFGLKEEM